MPIFISINVNAQVSPELFLNLNKVTTTERTAIPIAELTEGMMIFNSDDDNVYFFNGNIWIPINGIGTQKTSDFLSAEYPNSIFSDPGGANVGCINVSNTGAANNFLNAYYWETSETTTQSYDIIIRYLVPNDFKELQDEWFSVKYSAAASAKVNLTITKDDNTSIVPSSDLTATTAGTFDTHDINSTPTINAGDILIITLKLSAVENIPAAVSDIEFKYVK